MGEWEYILYGAIGIIVIAYVIYMYIQGSRGVEYHSFYEFVRHPSWENFRIWYADMANDVWGNIVFALIYSIIPIPFLEQLNMKFIDRFLASLGLTYVTNAVILGKPSYDVNQIWTTADYIVAYVVIAIVVVFLGGDFLKLVIQKK